MSAEKVFLQGGGNEWDFYTRSLGQLTNMGKTAIRKLAEERALKLQKEREAQAKANVKPTVVVKSALSSKAKQAPHTTTPTVGATDTAIPRNAPQRRSASVPTAVKFENLPKATAPIFNGAMKAIEATGDKELVREVVEGVDTNVPLPAPVANAVIKTMNELGIPASVSNDIVFHVSDPIDTLPEVVEAVATTEEGGEDEDGSQPILCRTGTKKDIAWWLIERFDPVFRKTYVEAFFGGGAIFWQKPKVGTEIINEWNPLVADFYKRLQRGLTETPNLMPELSLYTQSLQAYDKTHGANAWLKKLQEHFGKSYLSSTVINLDTQAGKDQMKQVDRISRVIIPFLRENPVKTKIVKDKAEAEYDVIDHAVKGGATDNLVCLYWYILSFCAGQGGTANIPIKDLQCIAENDKNLVKYSPDEEGKKDAKPQMPLKKSPDPFNKLNMAGRGRWFVNRLKGVTIYNDDALTICPKHDSPNTFFMLDPPYEAGGGYGITTTSTSDVLEGSAKPKKEEYPALRPDKDNVFPFRAFVRMVDKLKGKVMVTINGSKNILELFQGKDASVKLSKKYYASKIWVSNKASKGATKSARFEIVYANYKFKDSEDVNSEAFINAPEYFISSSEVIPIEYTKPVLPYQDYKKVEGNAVKGDIKINLKPKNEDKPDKPPKPHPCVSTTIRKAPISDSVLPFIGSVSPTAVAEETTPAPKARKARAKKAVAPAVAESAVPTNEIVNTAPVAKPKRVYKRKPKATDEAPTLEPFQEGQGRPRGGGYLGDNGAIVKGMIGGAYSPHHPHHLGSTFAYSPPSLLEGNGYQSCQW